MQGLHRGGGGDGGNGGGGHKIGVGGGGDGTGGGGGGGHGGSAGGGGGEGIEGRILESNIVERKRIQEIILDASMIVSIMYKKTTKLIVDALVMLCMRTTLTRWEVDFELIVLDQFKTES
ncbi:ATP-dependent RNA helicase dbp2-like [Amaranthus tricolor]|uniref:ATP-dependent RNA helicase dbp2-like n=1 Tax=Amaranthus tricolor TaxID=29722 RepID=UPI00258F57DD|nr:ATP-dependent RNA helicase dbp2-like [Amaranthus tricolor]